MVQLPTIKKESEMITLTTYIEDPKAIKQKVKPIIYIRFDYDGQDVSDIQVNLAGGNHFNYLNTPIQKNLSYIT